MFKDAVRSRKIIIEAPAEKVWQVLCDFECYPQWNSFTYKVEGRAALGEWVDLHVQMKAGHKRIQREQVCVLESGRQISWQMQMLSAVLLAAQRDQFIEVIDETRCSYETIDRFNGLLTPLVVAMYGKHIEKGFNALAEALKSRCEEC